MLEFHWSGICILKWKISTNTFFRYHYIYIFLIFCFLSNCTPILITHKDIQPNGAFIIDEVMLPDIDYISQGYMALKIPFGNTYIFM